jgi:hypothetical protein
MHRQPQRVIFTDANQFAGAGFTVGDHKIVHFMWEKQDIIKIIFPQILAKFLHVNCV